MKIGRRALFLDGAARWPGRATTAPWWTRRSPGADDQRGRHPRPRAPHVRPLLHRLQPGPHLTRRDRRRRGGASLRLGQRRAGPALHRLADLSARRRGGLCLPQAKPALFLELASVYGIDLAASTHVGDSVKDRDAAAAAGIGTFVWPREFFGWPQSSAQKRRSTLGAAVRSAAASRTPRIDAIVGATSS